MSPSLTRPAVLGDQNPLAHPAPTSQLKLCSRFEDVSFPLEGAQTYKLEVKHREAAECRVRAQHQEEESDFFPPIHHIHLNF